MFSDNMLMNHVFIGQNQPITESYTEVSDTTRKFYKIKSNTLLFNLIYTNHFQSMSRDL